MYFTEWRKRFSDDNDDVTTQKPVDIVVVEEVVVRKTYTLEHSLKNIL